MLRRGGVRLPIALDSFQRDFGERSAAVLAERFPRIHGEIRGMAESLGCDLAEFSAWLMCMGCCLDVQGCTAVGFTHGGKAFFARNNDLPPALEKVCQSIFYQPEGGNRFVLNTSAFVNGEDGMNEHGLAAGMTFVRPKRAEIVPGISSVFLVRIVLEHCRTTAETVALVRSLPIASNCNILVADKDGDMAVIECNPNEIVVREPLDYGSGKYIAAANTFLSPKMRPHLVPESDDYFSHRRLKTIDAAFCTADIPEPLRFSQDLLAGRLGFLCQYPAECNLGPVWSSVANLTNGRIFRAEGNPMRKAFKADERLKERAKKGNS